MATKTLGVKFEVAGVKEATASLDSLRTNISSALNQNKKAIALYQSDISRIPLSFSSSIKQQKNLFKDVKVSTSKDEFKVEKDRQELLKVWRIRSASKKKSGNIFSQNGSLGEAPYDYIENSNQTLGALSKGQYKKAANTYIRPRVNAAYEGYLGGIGGAAGERTFNSLDNLFRRLTGREENRETVELGHKTIRELALTVHNPKLADRNRGKKISQKDINLGSSPNKSPGVVGSMIEQALMPLKTIQYSFYEGIGSNFGNRFAEGFNKSIEEDLDFSFERKGEVSGKAISYVASSGVEQLLEDGASVKDNFEQVRYALEDSVAFRVGSFPPESRPGDIEGLSEKFDTLFKSIIKSVTGIGDSYLRGFRRGSVQIEAMRQIEKEVAKQENIAPDLKGKKKVIYTVGGFAGDKGQRGKAIAKQLKPLVNDETEVIGAENKFTDVSTSAEINQLNWGINSLANVAKINLKGFNPDAVQLAAQVVNTLAKNPDIAVDLVGHSAGGFVVEEAQEILNLLGKGDKVKSKTVGTPNVRGGIKSNGTTRVMGEKDPFAEAEKAGEYAGISSPTENIAKGVADHSFQAYINSDDSLGEILGDSLDSDRVSNQRRKDSKFQGKLIELETLYSKYVSTIYQNIDDLGDELSVAPDRIVAKTRRNKLRDRGVNELNKKLERDNFRSIKVKDGVETAVLVSGGFSGAKGGSGRIFAKRLNGMVEDDETQYIGVRNPFTDVVTRDDLENPDPQKTIPKILEMFAKTHELGYNPDSVEIAAQVIDLLNKNPNLKVKFGGYSGGGYVAEDVMELLKSKGVDMSRVEVMGVGTPQLPGGIKNKEFKKILGESDPIMQTNYLKEVNNQVKDIVGFDIFPELMEKMQNAEGVDSHDLSNYVANSKEVQDFFYSNIPQRSELFGNYAEIRGLKSQIHPLGEQMEEVQKDDSLSSAEKMERLRSIRQQYINLLTEIYTLSKRAKEIGGGVVFDDEKNYAIEELQTAGIDIEQSAFEWEASHSQRPRPHARDVPVETPPEENLPEDLWEDAEEEEEKVVNSRSKKLAAKYKEYLQNLRQKSERNAGKTSQTVSSDFKNLNKNNQKEYIQTLRTTFNTKARIYRDAVKNGQLEVAKEQGEQLISLAAEIKNLYQNLEDDTDIDPGLKSSLAGYSRYATSVQNEVVDGAGGKGRSNVGLPVLFEEQLDLAAAAEDSLEDEGAFVAEGFIMAVLDSLSAAKEAGEKLVDAVEEGVRDKGEIKSPSRLFARLGRFVAEGFRQGISEISEAGDELEQRGRDAVSGAAEGIAEESERIEVDAVSEVSLDTRVVRNVGENASGGIPQFFSNILEQYPLLNKFKGVIGAIAGLFLGGLGISAIVSSLTRLSGEALETAMAFESLDRAIVFTSRNSIEGIDNLNFISNEAKRLTVDLTEAKQAYAGLIGAAKNTTIEGVQTERLFSAFAESAANRGIDAQSQGRLFTALEQIIGKRQFSAEEVKGQIGDIRGFGDFQGILAQAQGVSTAELAKMMSQGEVGLDVMPKVVALIEAQNAAADETQTAQQAQTQYNNSLIEFKNALGKLLQPLQKLKLNVLSSSLDLIAGKLGVIFELISITAVVALLAMFKKVNLVNVVTTVWTKSINLLSLALKKLWASKMTIIIGLGKLIAGYALVTAAYLAFSNVIALTKNQYQDIADGADSIADGMNRYREAIEAASTAQSDFNDEQGKLELKEGLKLPEWLQGIAGQERLNLDIVRKGLDWAYDRPGGKFLQYGPAALFMKDKFGKGNFTTEAERRDADRRVATGEISFRTGQLLMKSQPATKAAEEINKFDAQIREIQAKRLELLPGDTKALETSLEKEREVSKQRDVQLKILTTYQQELQNAIAKNKAVLELPDLSEEERKQAEKDLEDTEETLNEINSILSKVTKALSEFQRQLRNSNERINNFLERRGLQAQDERTEIITEGVETSKGDRVIQIELEAASRRELTDYISELESTIDEGRKRLESGALAEGYRLVSESAEANGLTLDSATIDRMLSEEGRSQAQKDALSELKALRENKTKLSQYQEQLAQNIQTNRNSLIDFNRTISDYFFRINQQIKEAQIEVLRVVEQISRANIRNKLQSALSPNANSFVNQLISSTQSLLDQAASYAERVLGQRGARIQFATTERSLQMELIDFARNVGGASDALLEFEKRLRGDNSTVVPQSRTVNSSNRDDSSTGHSPDSFAGKTKQIANRLGIDPHALMTIMLFESAGTLNPKIQGPNVPGQGRGRGLIQFMPATARRLGTSDAELAGMTDIDQLDYVEKYFAQFKGNFGAGKLENLYAAVLAGNPLKVNASDGYTTARKGAKTMMKDFGGKATELLEASSNDEKVTGNKILVRRSGQKTPEGMEILRYDLVKDGQVVDSIINGYSGVKNKQKFNTPENHVAKTLTPPPDGTWKINLNQAREVAAGKTNNDPNSAVGKYWVGLTPQFDTGRSAIGLHLENQALGSAGCLVFTDPTSIKKLTSWARDNGISNLELDLATVADSPWTKGMSADSTSAPAVRAERSTKELIDKQEQKLDLEDLLIQNQEKEALEIAIANNLKSDRRLVDFNIVDSQFALDKVLDAGKDLMSQYDFQSSADEAAKSIRAVNTAFSDRDLQISREIIKYTDEIKAINDLISQAPSEISMLRGFGMNDEADIITEKVAQAQLLLKPYEEILKSLFVEYENNLELAKSALKFTNEQNKLKEEAERLNKRSLLLTQKATVAEARGTVEQQRRVKVATEELRLQLEINRIKQENKPGEQRDALINNEREQSDINLDNIDYQSQLDELDIEKQLIDRKTEIDNKQAGFLSRYGFDFQANKLKKDNAIDAENSRFKKDLININQKYKGNSELLAEHIQLAEELNRVSLQSIENEFKSLGKTIEDNFITAAQGFFSKFVTEGISFVDQSEKERQVLEERLRYAEELVSLENQYREEPGKLAHLKNRARELNEEKLDKIRSEFNLFSRTVDLAKQAVMEFVKQLAVMVAQRAAAKFISSILGSAIGGAAGGGVSAVGNDYGSGAGIGAFTADEGVTVGDDIKSRKIDDRNTSVLKSKFPGIASSWNAEGEGAQLGVFHVGEELLSRKTGEAGRYQMLKREYGINPLAKVLNYSEGGTIPGVGSNILSGFSNARPRSDLGAINSRLRSDAKAPAGTTVYLSETIYARDADSFRLNEDQRNQDLVEKLRRGI